MPEGREPRYLRTGTYLRTYCPVCGGDLIEGNWVLLKATGPDEERLELKLSPRFNIFEKEATVQLRRGVLLRDLRCPRCDHSLLTEESTCEICEAPAARMRITVMETEVEIYICTRIGCPWHGLREEDRRRLRLSLGETL